MVGIIVLNYQTWNETIKCIESILENITIEFHIYLVDNKSTNGSFEILTDKYSNNQKVTVIQSGRNGGYSFGNNCGIEYAIKDNCDTALICNNDIVFLPESIEKIYNLLYSDSSIGVVAATLIDNKGNIQPRGFKKIPCHKQALSLLMGKLFKKDILNDYRIVEADEPSQAFRVNGGCFVIKMDVYNLIDKFDENTFVYYEESIIGSLLEKANYKAYFHDEAKVIHDHSATISMQKAMYYKELVRSELYYYKKYEKTNVLSLFFLYVMRISIYFNNCRKNEDYLLNKGDFLRNTWNVFINSYQGGRLWM